MKTIELSKKVYSCFSSGDLPGLIACLAEDVQFDLFGPNAIPYFGTYGGRAGVEEFFRRLLEHEEVLAFTPEEFIDGGDTVAVLGREHCRARATGRDFTVRWVHVFQGRGGRLVRFREYIDTAPMIEAYQK